jgi:hypothetical protein
VICVADSRVELCEIVTLLLHARGDELDELDDMVGLDLHVRLRRQVNMQNAKRNLGGYGFCILRSAFYIPQRSAGVCTGASQSFVSSSSSFTSVKEAPAISSEVM